MLCKRYCISLFPGSRPEGKPQFGSKEEKRHYEEIIQTFFSLSGFVNLSALGAFYADLTEKEATQLAARPEVRSVELAVSRKTSKITQANAGWALASLSGETETYSYSATGKGVDIYIVDTGTNVELPEFEGRATEVYTNKPGEALTCPHGTAVAAGAAGRLYGTAKQASILAVRAEGPSCTVLSHIGLNAVLDHHSLGTLAICVMSFGTATADTVEEDAVNALIAEGILCVAAAGNDALETLHYPAAYCMSVAASAAGGTAASFTNYGSSIDFFAPGELCLTTDLNGAESFFSGTSISAPYVAGILACLLEIEPQVITQAEAQARLIDFCDESGVGHSLANTTHCLVQNNLPIVWKGLEGSSSPEYLEGLDFRKAYDIQLSLEEQNGDNTAVSDSAFLVKEKAAAAVTVSLGGTFTKQNIGVTLEVGKPTSGDSVPSSPDRVPSVGRRITLQASVGLATPEELVTLMLNLTPNGGTAAFSTVLDTKHEIQEVVELQGVECTVERIGPDYGPGRTYGVECAVLPTLNAKYISISHMAIDGILLSVKELIQEAASLVGVKITILAVDIKVLEFVQAGTFLEILESLASLLYAVPLQQNGVWLIDYARIAHGDFDLNAENLTAFSQEAKGDAAPAIDLANRLIGALVQEDKLQEELDDLKEELEAAEDIAELEEEAGKELEDSRGEAQFLGNVQIKFGQVNNSQWQNIDSAYRVEALGWEYWTPEAGKSVNPEEPGKRYYSVQTDPETGEMRGLNKLGSCDILVEIQEPSNFGGLYFVRGKCVNFLENISETLWTSPTVLKENLINEVTHVYEEKTFLKFTVQMNTNNPAAAQDKQMYFLDLEVRYLPSLLQRWKFSGQLLFDYWPVKAGTHYVGRINREGVFLDPSGRQVTVVTDLADLPFTDCQVQNAGCVIDSDGGLSGYFLTPFFYDIAGNFAGNLNSANGKILSNSTTEGTILGWLPGDTPASLTWPGLGDTTELKENSPIYFTSVMPGAHGIDFSDYDPDHPELWNPEEDPADSLEQTHILDLKWLVLRKENELATQRVLITFLEAELRSYGAGSLIPLIHVAAEAKLALIKEQERQAELNIKNMPVLQRRQTALGTAMAAIYAELSALNLQTLQVDCTFLYDNLLPLPQSIFSISGRISQEDLIISSASLSLKAKTVSVTATRRIA